MNELYIKIKNTREDLDIKQYEFAKILNINYKTYNLYENGTRSMPVEVLDKVATNLNVSVDFLFGKTKQKRYEKSRKMNYHKLLNNIRELRLSHNDTLRILAKQLNVTPQTLNNYELGNRTLPISILYGISCIYNVSMDVLLNKVKKTNSSINS